MGNPPNSNGQKVLQAQLPPVIPLSQQEQDALAYSNRKQTRFADVKSRELEMSRRWTMFRHYAKPIPCVCGGKHSAIEVRDEIADKWVRRCPIAYYIRQAHLHLGKPFDARAEFAKVVKP